ncbi:MAG: DUF1640 domain-containing protein [Acidobacteria bacterium]|nr:DUF1640 domain-containing protein [Acidobacteriota bacterium]
MVQVATGDLDRRVALLEGWKESQEPFVLSLKDDVREVQARLTALQSHMDHRFSSVEASIAELRVELKGDIAELRTELKGDIAELRTELKGDIAELRTELKDDIAELRTELKDDIAELRTELKGEMARLVQRMDTQTRWIIGVQFLTLLTLIAALLRLAG